MKMNQVALLSDFSNSPFKTIKGFDRPILLIKEGDRIHAVDNRCPHMGFPLSKGTIKEGILTCHWHHARFDAQSGCAFDLFADDIPSYDVAIEGEAVLISETPRSRPNASYYQDRLQQGLEQNISIIIYKSIIGLLNADVDHLEIVHQIGEFGSANHETWSDGMTLLAMTANLWDQLEEDTRAKALCKAARRVASNCSGQPARRERQALGGGRFNSGQLVDWFRQWSMTRHRDGAERTLLTQIAHGDSLSLSDMLFGALHDRVYSNSGHNVDFANKAIELSQLLQEDAASRIMPLVVKVVTEAWGEEERSGWRSPVDLIPIIKQAEERLASDWQEAARFSDPSLASLRDLLQGEDPQAIADEIVSLCQRNANPSNVAKEIAYVSALRLAQFPESNDIADWFSPVHSFNFANAVYRSIQRHRSLQSVRGLLHGALSVFQDRFLNIPKISLPNPDETLIETYKDNPLWRQNLLDTLDEKRSWKSFTEQVIAVFRARKSLAEIIDALASAALREDFDFHKLQSVEAAAVQARLWEGKAEAEHILAGAARHLAAHAPTPRGDSKMIDIARRLQRGEKIYEDVS